MFPRTTLWADPSGMPPSHFCIFRPMVPETRSCVCLSVLLHFHLRSSWHRLRISNSLAALVTHISASTLANPDSNFEQTMLLDSVHQSRSFVYCSKWYTAVAVVNAGYLNQTLRVLAVSCQNRYRMYVLFHRELRASASKFHSPTQPNLAELLLFLCNFAVAALMLSIAYAGKANGSQSRLHVRNCFHL